MKSALTNYESNNKNMLNFYHIFNKPLNCLHFTFFLIQYSRLSISSPPKEHGVFVY